MYLVEKKIKRKADRLEDLKVSIEMNNDFLSKTADSLVEKIYFIEAQSLMVKSNKFWICSHFLF